VCSRVLSNGEVLPAALELARDIAVNTAPLSVAFSKQLLWDSWARDPRQIEKLETEAHHHLMANSDAVEGVTAFLEHRPPAWSGRLDEDWLDGWPGDGASS
jgi:enoyl-CoA hydratase/carnithine racemase